MTGSENVHGFVWTSTRYLSGTTIAREHPAYRRPDGRVVWAPDRGYWCDAPERIAVTFLPAGPAAHDESVRRGVTCACHTSS